MAPRGNTHERLEQSEVRRGSDRAFGFVFAGACAIAAAIAFWRGSSNAWMWPVGSAAFLAAALVRPVLLSPLNRFWHAFGLVLHRIVSPLVMGAVFFLAVTPIGLLARASRKDFLRLRRDRSLGTYWIERHPPGPEPETMSRQF